MNRRFGRRVALPSIGFGGGVGGSGPLVLLGDSLSVGTGPYLKELVPDAIVIAKVGASISWMGEQVDKIAALAPRQVLIMGGTNDIGWSTPDQAVSVVNKMGLLVNDLQPFTRVVVGQIPTMKGREATVDRYNDLLASRFNAAPIGDVIAPGELADGVHPGPSGYRKMAEAWASNLASPRSQLLAVFAPVLLGIIAFVGYRRFGD